MVEVERANDLRHLILISKEYPNFKIFLDDPPVILNPSKVGYKTRIEDQNFAKLLDEYYFNKRHGTSFISYQNLCFSMSSNGQMFYIFCRSHFISINLLNGELKTFYSLNKWELQNEANFEYWFFEVHENKVIFYNNETGLIHLMEFDCASNVSGIKFNETREFEARKQRLIKIYGQKYLVLNLNELELKLYSVNNKSPLKQFKDIPNCTSLHHCIQLDDYFVYILNLDDWGLIKQLTIIDIVQEKRRIFHLNDLNLFNLSACFLMDTFKTNNVSHIMSKINESPSNFEKSIKDMFKQTFDAHSCRAFNFYFDENRKVLNISMVDRVNRPSNVLIAHLDLESGKILRTVFDWPSFDCNPVFKSHFTFNENGQIQFLTIDVDKKNVFFKSTVIYGTERKVTSLCQLCLFSTKQKYPKYFIV